MGRSSIGPLLEIIVLLIILVYAHRTGLLKKLLDNIGNLGKGGTGGGAGGLLGTEVWSSSKLGSSPKSWKAGDPPSGSGEVSVINSGATAEWDGSVLKLGGPSPRFYISGDFTSNVDFSAYFKGGAADIMMVAPSNHEERPGGFGGYYYYIADNGAATLFKKEIQHGNGYSSRLDEKKFTQDKAAWTGMRIVVTTSGKTVKADGYINAGGGGWKLTNSITDDGKLRGAPFTGKAKWVFIRANSPSNLQVKDISVRTISGSEGGTTTPAETPPAETKPAEEKKASFGYTGLDNLLFD